MMYSSLSSAEIDSGMAIGGRKSGGRGLRNKDRSRNRDERGVDLRLAIRGRDDVAGRQEGDEGASGDIAVCRRGDKCWECLYTERHVNASHFIQNHPSSVFAKIR